MSTRGFMVVKAFEKDGIMIPRRKTDKSAGYDIESAITTTIQPKQIGLVSTGLKAHMAQDEVLNIYARSSLFQTKNLILTNGVGVIDADYFDNPTNEGHIMIALYNISDSPVTIAKGERIAQGVFTKYLLTHDDDSPKAVRTGGFGSTGR